MKADTKLAMVLILFLGTLGGAACASKDSAPAGLLQKATAKAQGDAAPAKERMIKRSRYVTFDLDSIREKDGSLNADSPKVQTLRLNLFDDAVYEAVLDRLARKRSGAWAWTGHLKGEDGSNVTLIINKDIVAGNIFLTGAAYAIRSAGEGLHIVREIDRSNMPKD